MVFLHWSFACGCWVHAGVFILTKMQPSHQQKSEKDRFFLQNENICCQNGRIIQPI